MLSAFLPYYAARAGCRARRRSSSSPATGTSSTSHSARPTSSRTRLLTSRARGRCSPTSAVPDDPALRLSRSALGPGEPDTWAERPVVLPAGWKAIHVERLWVRGASRSPNRRRGALRSGPRRPSAAQGLVSSAQRI
jgi:hypothetical protein